MLTTHWGLGPYSAAFEIAKHIAKTQAFELLLQAYFRYSPAQQSTIVVTALQPDACRQRLDATLRFVKGTRHGEGHPERCISYGVRVLLRLRGELQAGVCIKPVGFRFGKSTGGASGTPEIGG